MDERLEFVDKIIKETLLYPKNKFDAYITGYVREAWEERGWAGIMPFCVQYLGITKMYRENNDYIVIEFTHDDWHSFLFRFNK